MKSSVVQLNKSGSNQLFLSVHFLVAFPIALKSAYKGKKYLKKHQALHTTFFFFFWNLLNDLHLWAVKTYQKLNMCKLVNVCINSVPKFSILIYYNIFINYNLRATYIKKKMLQYAICIGNVGFLTLYSVIELKSKLYITLSLIAKFHI